MEISAKREANGPTPPAHVRPANQKQVARDCSPLTVAIQQLTMPPSAESWDAIRALAKIVTTPDERPIRSPVTGRRRIVTGAYASRKARRSLPHESMNELAFMQLCEVDTEIVDYRSQPFRFEFALNGAQRVYIADCARLHDDRCVEVIEIKSDLRGLKDPDYAAKLNAVREICQRIGWRFKIVLKEQLFFPSAWRKNVLLVQSQRHVRYAAPEMYRALDVLSQEGGQTELGRLAHALGDPRRGRAVMMAMMVGRLVDIDLRDPISDQSLVRDVRSGSVEARA